MVAKCTILVSIFAMSASVAVLAAQVPMPEKPKTETPKVYASPEAVFQAYRQGLAKNDARIWYFCLVPTLRDEQVIESLFACGIHMAPDDPVRKKFGLDDASLGSEYNKRYEKKYGVNPSKVHEEYYQKLQKAQEEFVRRHGNSIDKALITQEAIKQIGPMPQLHDQGLYRLIVLEKVTDKIGFVAAVEAALRTPGHDPIKFSPIRNVRIVGDSASGQTTGVHYGLRREPGGPEKKMEYRYDQTVQFRKTKDG